MNWSNGKVRSRKEKADNLMNPIFYACDAMIDLVIPYDNICYPYLGERPDHRRLAQVGDPTAQDL